MIAAAYRIGHWPARLLSLLFVLIALAVSALAQDYPDYQEIHVNDFADLLTENQKEALRGKLAELRDKRGIEFTVVTISRMSDYGHTGALEPFATGLFNDWGVGKATRNDGVMMLVARFDRKIRIEVGAGYGSDKNVVMKKIIDDVILPDFRDDRYAEGISDGVDAVIHDLTGDWPGEIGASAWRKFWGGLGRLIETFWYIATAVGVALLALPVQIYRRWRRNKPRICPVDRSRMERLSEEWDDNHLQQGQITEEQLKSVDYDVWECPECQHRIIEGYKAWFSGYGACRSCGFRTVEGTTEIIQQATTSSSGLKRIDYYCHHCQDAYSVEKTIPKKSSSSSSGSSSFGGGSSSGGGASGSW